jgi:heme-degrading monooxygenase HmoA
MADADMICRIWHGRTHRSKADEHEKFLIERAIPDYLSVHGNIDVSILRMDEDEVAHFITQTHWESEESIRAFAGIQTLKARYYPEEGEYLLEFEPEVVHYKLVFTAITD